MVHPGRSLRFSAAALALTLAASFALHAEPGRYLELEAFLEGVFGGVPAQADTLLIDAELRDVVESILDHRFSQLRVRYWDDGETTAWVLDEIGKTEPITIGISVHGGRIGRIRVLEFRESRGWEIRHPFFTDQFTGAGLTSDQRIDRRIDGITGATLSVAAARKLARIALLFDARVRQAQGDSVS